MDNYLKQEKVQLDLVKIVCPHLNHPHQWLQKHWQLLTGKHPTNKSPNKLYLNLPRDQKDLNGVYPDKLTPQKEVILILSIKNLWEHMDIIRERS